MEKLLIEVVNQPIDLEIGDIIIYSMSREMRVARVIKKPTTDKRGCYKSTKCMINQKVIERHVDSYDYVMKKVNILNYTIKSQVFDLEEFNTVKYIKFEKNQKILKVIK